MRLISGLGLLLLLVVGCSAANVKEQSAGGSSGATSEQAQGSAVKPADSGKPKGKSNDEPGCSD